MFKHLLTVFLFTSLLLLISCPAKAQQIKNPDGENISIHFTPYFTDATFKVFDKKADLNQTFNFNIMVKMPLSPLVTVSMFYKTENFELEFIAIKKKSYGITLSIYFE